MAKVNKKYNKILKKYRVKLKEVLKPPEAALETLKNDRTIPVLTLGNFSLLIGKAKSKKSFLVGYLISIILSGNKILSNQFYSSLNKDRRKVLYFDTEQGKYHGQVAFNRICRLLSISNPKDLKMYCLRSLTPRERLEVIEHAIYGYDDLCFVVIDGIKDLITSINDEKEATEIASKLLKWTEERNLHIMCVLHQNKGDNNARGHLGSELVHKAETVLTVTKDSNNKEVSIVEPTMCRNEEPDSFAFEIVDGLPLIIEDYEMQPRRKNNIGLLDIPDYEKFQFLNEVYSTKDKYLLTDLTNTLQSIVRKRKPSIASGNVAMRALINYMKDKKWLLQEAPKKPYTLGKYES